MCRILIKAEVITNGWKKDTVLKVERSGQVTMSREANGLSRIRCYFFAIDKQADGFEWKCLLLWKTVAMELADRALCP